MRVTPGVGTGQVHLPWLPAPEPSPASRPPFHALTPFPRNQGWGEGEGAGEEGNELLKERGPRGPGLEDGVPGTPALRLKRGSRADGVGDGRGDDTEGVS